MWDWYLIGYIRETCEASVGALFAGDLASYLDSVFSRSTARVPAGIHLFYET